MTNYYDILGISIDATQSDIKSAYRKLSFKFHPDKNNGEAFFEEIYKKVNLAYEVLSDVRKRAEYDKELIKYNDNGRLIKDYQSKEAQYRQQQQAWHSKNSPNQPQAKNNSNKKSLNIYYILIPAALFFIVLMINTLFKQEKKVSNIDSVVHVTESKKVPRKTRRHKHNSATINNTSLNNSIEKKINPSDSNGITSVTSAKPIIPSTDSSIKTKVEHADTSVSVQKVKHKKKKRFLIF